MARKRTAAQIRATKKLVALNKARARGKTRKNKAGPRRTVSQRIKAALQMKRGHKATAAWVRSGMPDRRNRPRKKKTACNPRRKSGPTLTMAQGRKLYELGKRAPKTPVAIRSNGRGVTIVTGKAVRKLMKNGKHICDTDHPTAPCCWAARNAELLAMRKRDAARKAAYDSRTPEQIAKDKAAARAAYESVMRS